MALEGELIDEPAGIASDGKSSANLGRGFEGEPPAEWRCVLTFEIT